MNDREKRAEVLTSDEYFEENFKEEDTTEQDKKFEEFWQKRIEEILKEEK